MLPSELVTVGERERDEQDETASKRYDDVEIRGRAYGNRRYERRNAENPENVEDIGTNYVADSDVVMSFFRRDDGGDEFGERSSDRDDGEADEDFGESGDAGQVNRTFDKEFASNDKPNEPNGGKGRRFEVSVFRSFGHFFRNFVRFSRCETVDVVHENNEESKEHEPVAHPKNVFFSIGEEDVVSHDEEHDDRKNREGNLFPCRRPLNLKVRDEGTNSENEKDIGGIASDDVSYGDVGISLCRRGETDDEFGRRSSKRYDREPDDDGGDSCPFRERSRAFDEAISTDNQDGEPDGNERESEKKFHE